MTKKLKIIGIIGISAFSFLLLVLIGIPVVNPYPDFQTLVNNIKNPPIQNFPDKAIGKLSDLPKNQFPFLQAIKIRDIITKELRNENKLQFTTISIVEYQKFNDLYIIHILVDGKDSHIIIPERRLQ